MGILKIIRHTNAELFYLHNAIRYVTGGHTDPDYIGSPNVFVPDAYEQMLKVKQYFGKTSGNPLFHFVVVYDASTAFDPQRAMSLTAQIASYFSSRYQIVWCVHEKHMSKKYGRISSLYHAHLVMNSVSYIDGKMFQNTKKDIFAFLEHIRSVTRCSGWDIDYNCWNGSEKDAYDACE